MDTPPAVPDSAQRPRFAVISIFALILIIAAVVAYFWSSEPKELKKAQIAYYTNTAGINREERVKTLEEAVKISDRLNDEQESTAKIMLADSLGEIDRVRSLELFKEVAINEAFPKGNRSLAINMILDNIELDFIENNFLKSRIFKGGAFGELLQSSNGDVNLAVRKLNEWSVNLFPNTIAHYRLAKWYAAEIYKNTGGNQNALKQEVSHHLAAGDALFEKYKNNIHPTRRGIAYETKARALRLSGGSPDKIREYFRLAGVAYLEEPQTIFQIVHLTMMRLYRAAYLAETFGETETEFIRKNLESTVEYLKTPQPVEHRNVRLVSFLIAARDSRDATYPSVDLSNLHIVKIGDVYPEFKDTVNTLDLREYAKDHPLETEINSR